MKLLKRILVATDFSNTCDNVVDNAIEMAKIFDSEIGLVYVLPDDIKSNKTKELLETFAVNQLNTLNDKINKKGVQTSTPIMESGDFSQKIVTVAEKTNANIILIGAGEKIHNDSFKLGSNAEKIIKKSDKPVFVVKNDKSLSIQKVLCPVDFSKESKLALKNAITLCHKFNAELKILSVYETSHLNSIRLKIDMEKEIELIRNDCQKQLDSFLNDFHLSGLKVTTEIKPGDPATVILREINTNNNDLLIIGTTGKSGLSRIFMGSVTEKVIREIPASFITLKNKDAITLEIDAKINDIESHFNIAQQLFEDGLYEESIMQYKKCLNISFMHIPSLKGLSKVYEILGDTSNEQKYEAMIKEILDKMNDQKIESEIRNYSY